jgi:hypothetical protein
MFLIVSSRYDYAIVPKQKGITFLFLRKKNMFLIVSSSYDYAIVPKQKNVLE